MYIYIYIWLPTSSIFFMSYPFSLMIWQAYSCMGLKPAISRSLFHISVNHPPLLFLKPLVFFFMFFFGRFSHPQLLFPKCCHYSLPHNHPQSPISRGFIQQTGILDPEAIYWCVLRLTSLRPSSASWWWDQQSSGYILYDVYLDIRCGYTFFSTDDDLMDIYIYIYNQ